MSSGTTSGNSGNSANQSTVSFTGIHFTKSSTDIYATLTGGTNVPAESEYDKTAGFSRVALQFTTYDSRGLSTDATGGGTSRHAAQHRINTFDISTRLDGVTWNSSRTELTVPLGFDLIKDATQAQWHDLTVWFDIVTRSRDSATTDRTRVHADIWANDVGEEIFNIDRLMPGGKAFTENGAACFGDQYTVTFKATDNSTTVGVWSSNDSDIVPLNGPSGTSVFAADGFSLSNIADASSSAGGNSSTSLTLTELKSATASSVATQLIDEFDMTYAGGITCGVDTFTNITTAQTNTLKRRYSALAAEGGDSDYATLRSDAESATTVTTHALEESKAIGQNLSSYTSGLKQYKLVVDDSEFDLTGNTVLNSITTRLENMLRRELINLSNGIGNLSTTSVTTAITNNTTSAINETVDKTCIQALITESPTTDVNRQAGVFGGGVQKFIQQAGEASDGGEHIATMLNNLKTVGTSGATSMIHVDGSTLNIGIRRVICETNSPNNNTNFVNSALHNAVNSITEKLMQAAKTMIRIELLNSEL